LNYIFDLNSGKDESILKVLIPSICGLDVYVESFFPTAFKFLKYSSKLFLIPKFDIKSFETIVKSFTTVLLKLFVFKSLLVPVE
jgi:hypothetical protein